METILIVGVSVVAIAVFSTVILSTLGIIACMFSSKLSRQEEPHRPKKED